jgi:uncharacterized protein YraI
VSLRISITTSIALLLLSTGCGRESRAVATPSPAPLIVTSTLPVTPTPRPSDTPRPPPAQPTATPVEGITSTQVNVRAEPSTASNVLGMIPANTKVEITGKDPGENWWQINYAQSMEGKGWVTAQFVTTADKPQVPVIGEGETDSNSGNIAIIQQQLNVRSGPGTDFNSLGTLNPQDVVNLTGKDSNGAWLQIDFPTGPEGKGWINAAFAQAHGIENLPIVTEGGDVVGTGTPTSVPSTPTPTLVPAWEDNDSPSSPIANVVFEPNGTSALIYNGDLSAPQGDTEDWISFKPYGAAVFLSLACAGSEALSVEMSEDGLPVKQPIACGDRRMKITVKAEAVYLIHLHANSAGENLQYTNYTLTLNTRAE